MAQSPITVRWQVTIDDGTPDALEWGDACTAPDRSDPQMLRELIRLLTVQMHELMLREIFGEHPEEACLPPSSS